MPHITNWAELLNSTINSYTKDNRNSSLILDAVGEGCGQAFTSPITLSRLTNAVFYLQRNAAFVAPGTIEARLYPVFPGTVVGTTAVPNILNLLATSDPVNAADIEMAWGLVNFHFSTPYTLDPDRGYVIVLVITNCPAGGQVEVGIDTTILPTHFPVHPGNETNNITLPPLWTPNPLNDCIFYLFSYSDVLAGGTIDVTDRPGREVGKVQLTDYTNDGIVYPDSSIPIAPAKVEVASLDSLVGAAAFFDAVNLALNTDHRGSGTQSVEWDKAGTNIASGVQITLPAALDLSVYSTHAQVMWYGLIPDPAPDNVTQVYVALGTDNANYFYWAIPVADIHLGVFWHYHHLMSEVDGIFGVGADLSSVTWAAIVVVTDAVASTFADARIDQIVVKRSTEAVIHVCDGEAIPTDVIDRAARLLGVVEVGGGGSAEPYWLVTDKDVEFTGAIAQDAEEDESLAGLAANKIVITDVAFEGKENLQFRLIFWSKDTFEDADLDVDTFLGYIDIDVPNCGFQKGGAGQYYLNVTKVDLHYEDEDASNELHVSLNCVSAAGKTAGVPGEVKVKIGYKVRE